MKCMVCDSEMVPFFGGVCANCRSKRTGVYVVKGERWHKIGCTYNLERRFKELSDAVPFELTLVHFIPCYSILRAEAFLHNLYKDKLVKNEWFLLDDEDVEAIKRVKSFPTTQEDDPL